MDVENANCKVKVSQCTDMEIMDIERPLKIDIEIPDLAMLVQELHRVFSRDHVNVQDVQKLLAGYKSNPKDWKRFAKFDRFRYTRNLVDAGNGLFNIMILCWGPGHASAIHDHADSHCFMKLLSGALEEVRHPFDMPTTVDVVAVNAFFPEWTYAVSLIVLHLHRALGASTELLRPSAVTNVRYDWPENVQPEVSKVLNRNNNRTDSRCHCNNRLVASDASCQNDSCQTDSHEQGSKDRRENDAGSGDEEDYDIRDMNETGRTRLEVNDVCYINDALGLHRMENPSHVDGAVSLHLYCPPFDSCRVFDARTGRPTQVQVTFWSMYGKKVNRVIQAAGSVADSQQ